LNPFEIGLTGGLEILVILLLAFLAIGPGRVIRAARWARNLGKGPQKMSSQSTQATKKADRPRKQGRPRAKVVRPAGNQGTPLTGGTPKGRGKRA